MPIRRCATPEDVAATLDAVQTQQGEAFFVFLALRMMKPAKAGVQTV